MALYVDQQTIGTSAVQLDAGILAQGLELTAKSDNTNILYVGVDGDVTSSTGYALEAGKTCFVGVRNANEVWVIGGAAGQVLSVIGT